MYLLRNLWKLPFRLSLNRKLFCRADNCALRPLEAAIDVAVGRKHVNDAGGLIRDGTKKGT